MQFCIFDIRGVLLEWLNGYFTARKHVSATAPPIAPSVSVADCACCVDGFAPVGQGRHLKG